MQRMTRQRAAVLELLSDQGEFRSAHQIHESLTARGQAIGLATVYRTLQGLAEVGEIDVLRRDGETTFRRCERRAHHHHLVCRQCGLTVELQGDLVERWARELADLNGFVEVENTLEFSGLCANCAKGGS